MDNVDRATTSNQSYQAHAAEVEIQTLKSEEQSYSEMNIISNFSGQNNRPCNVLLATAKIRVESKAGCRVLRALLDQGSQASFVTEETVQILGLTKSKISGSVSGIGDGVTRINHMVNMHVESFHHPEKSINVQAYVLKSLTSL